VHAWEKKSETAKQKWSFCLERERGALTGKPGWKGGRSRSLHGREEGGNYLMPGRGNGGRNLELTANEGSMCRSFGRESSVTDQSSRKEGKRNRDISQLVGREKLRLSAREGKESAGKRGPCSLPEEERGVSPSPTS